MERTPRRSAGANLLWRRRQFSPRKAVQVPGSYMVLQDLPAPVDPISNWRIMTMPGLHDALVRSGYDADQLRAFGSRLSTLTIWT